MRLLIVVDKLLTGFDAPACTYLYIDKQMQDHGLFQAICRTNRLGKEDENDPYYKEFGYIIDYKSLLDFLNKSITDYTSDAFDAFDLEDVNGLLTNRLEKAKECLSDAIEALHELCSDVPMPGELEQYCHFFCGDPSNPDDLKNEPDMRQMLDMYLTADPSRVLSNLGDATLLQLIVENGIEAAKDKLPEGIKSNPGAMSETIENNMRKPIIQEMPINPAYYEKMSVLLVQLIKLRKEGAIAYEELLKEYEKLAKDIQPNTKKNYPIKIDSKSKQALYDNLGENEDLAVSLDEKIISTKDDDWRGTHIKRRKVYGKSVWKSLCRI